MAPSPNVVNLFAVMSESLLIGKLHHARLKLNSSRGLMAISIRLLRGAYGACGVAVNVRVHRIASHFRSSIPFAFSSRRRTMPTMHKVLFWASIIMFLVSVTHLALVVEQSSIARISLVNLRTRVILAIVQVRRQVILHATSPRLRPLSSS